MNDNQKQTIVNVLSATACLAQVTVAQYSFGRNTSVFKRPDQKKDQEV